MKAKTQDFGPHPSPRAKRSLGQNFLVDGSVAERIVAALAPVRDDIILEIGPGQGALTERLIDRAGRVIALELDRELATLLRKQFAGRESFQLIENDALEIDFGQLVTPPDRLRLIANLPYNISTAILQRLFDEPATFSDAVLMFQREVVERITAAPGTKERGFLTVLTELYFAVERLFDVPPTAFRPRPKVWSSVVRLTPKEAGTVDAPAFREMLSTAFAQKRKTILNNLKVRFGNADDILSQAGIDSGRRAETLTLDEWNRLFEALR